MNLVAELLSRPLKLVGHGTNHEGETFVGRLEIQSLVNGSSLLLHYTATRTDGKHLHKEATMLGTSLNRGGRANSDTPISGNSAS